MATTTAILNTNSLYATAAELTLTTETVVTLSIVAKTGASLNHCVILQQSPNDGTTWLDIPPPLTGLGSITHILATTKVRAKVIKVEGGTSTVDIHIVAR